MKKKIASLFAVVLLLALAGCGSKVNDHVVDYHVDVPNGFVESELEGADACWVNPVDQSNVNVTVASKQTAADLAFKAAGADDLRKIVQDSLKETYGVEAQITDRFFSKDDVCGLPAYQYSYEVTFNGLTATQIVVGVNADKTYTFTYTTSDAAILAAFEESARNIQLTIE